MKQLQPKWSRHILQVAIASKRRKGRSMHELRSRFCFATRVIPHIHLRTRHARRWFAKKRFCNRFVPSRYVLQGCKRRDHHRLLVLHSNMPPPPAIWVKSGCTFKRNMLVVGFPILQAGSPRRKRSLLAVTNNACGRMKMRRGKRECVWMEQASACIPSLLVLFTYGHAQHWSSSCVHPSSSAQRMNRRGSIGTGVPLPQAFRSSSFLHARTWAC